MKKLILGLMVAAFAVAVQAGEGKECKDKAACGDKAKASSTAQAKAACGDKSACCNEAKPTVAKKVLMSPKAMSLASK
jgi:hypothetical protein